MPEQPTEPSAGEREGLAPRKQEPSAGEREGLAPRKQEPVGRFDHIGIAVHSIDNARGFFEDVLGAKHRRTADHHTGDFRIALFDLHDFCIELLEPINPEGFLAKFLDKRGEGFHHLTLQTPDLEEKVAVMEKAGVRVVDKSFDDPASIDAFISPKSAHGLLIQLGQTPGPLNNPPYWEDDSD